MDIKEKIKQTMECAENLGNGASMHDLRMELSELSEMAGLDEAINKQK